MSGLRIGTIWNIPIRLHSSWFIIFGLLTWSLSRDYFVAAYPNMGSGVYLSLGLVTSLLFFGSVLAHELGHSWLALRDGIPVRGITLFIFGGVAQIEREARTPASEFRIATAGPVTSLLLAGIFYILFNLDKKISYLAAPSEYLMRINFMLAIFNLIPGFPLDGGRILRAAVWAWNKDLRKATRFAALVGQVIAYIFIGIGIFSLFQGKFSNGLWLIFIGWFLQSTASSIYQQINIETSLRSSTVSQVMSREMVKLPGLTPLDWVIEEHVLANKDPAIYVVEYGEISGLLTIREITKIPKMHWRFTTINQAMVPLSKLSMLSPDTDLFSALERMEEAKVSQIPVVEGEDVIGTLSRENIARYLHMRTRLGV
jgi:Zn-dependent protease